MFTPPSLLILPPSLAPRFSSLRFSSWLLCPLTPNPCYAPLPMTLTCSPHTSYLSWLRRTVGVLLGCIWVRGTGEGVDVETKPRAEPDLPDPGPRLTDDPLVLFGDMTQSWRRPPSPPARSASAGNPTGFAPARPPFFGMESTSQNAPAPLTVALLMPPDNPCATTGTKPWVAKTNPLDTSTNVQDAVTRHMEHKTAVSQRKRHPLTPLLAEHCQGHSTLSSQRVLRAPS